MDPGVFDDGGGEGGEGGVSKLWLEKEKNYICCKLVLYSCFKTITLLGCMYMCYPVIAIILLK